ncbi:MAG TPA: cysteine desulfurase family protein [Myxococcota bacterium]|nr:cysteine desulfurase family protein [Myxococcota bacterium]
MQRPIYLDHHATTPLDPRVLDAMLPYLREEFGNAASRTHAYGWRAEAAVELAREEVAAAIGARDPREVVFTSGATESDNLALQGVLRARGSGTVAISAIEHPAVADTARALEREGFGARVLPVDGEGLVDPAALDAALADGPALVSILWANGEVGTVQPIAELASRCRERGVPFHSDAAQAVGKLPLDVERDGVDLLSFSAHKVYGPKGVGALYVRRARPRLRLAPLLHGGGHEFGLRSGSLPVPLVVGMGAALRIAVAEREAEAARLCDLRERLLARLSAALPGVRLNGPARARLAGNLNLSLAGVPGDALVASCPELALSTGSACASARPEPSPVLVALGLDPERVREGFRIGLGRGTSEADVDRAADVIAERAAKLRAERTASPRPGRAASLGSPEETR